MIHKVKIYVLSLVLLCIGICCDNGVYDGIHGWHQSGDYAGKQVTVVANMPSNKPNGRVTLNKGENGENKEIIVVNWREKDEKLLLMSKSEQSAETFRQISSETISNSTQFMGTLPKGNAPYYAFYSGKFTVSDTCKVTSLPYDLSVQTGELSDSLGNMYMYAKSDMYANIDNLSLDFEHLGIIVKLTLEGFTGTPQTISLKGDAISAKGTFDLTDLSHTVTDSIITINRAPDDGDVNTESYDLYIHLLPTLKSGKIINVNLVNSEGKTFEGRVSTTKPLQAGYLYTAFVELEPLDGTYVLTRETQAVAPVVGDGSEENPYELQTAENFLWFLELGSLKDHYKLTHSIEISEPLSAYANSLEGVFDGNGNSISGILNTALFGVIESNAIVRNLHTLTSSELANIASSSYYYGNANIASENKGTIENCTTSGFIKFNANVWANKHYAGGIAQINSGKIINCINSGDVTAYRAEGAGGIVGYNTGVIVNCQNHGKITYSGEWYAGGIVGKSEGEKAKIINCFNKGLVKGGLGGIVGYMKFGVIENSRNIGEIVDRSLCGGIGGELNKASVINCVNDGNISGDDSGAGIIAKIRDSSVEACVNNGEILGKFASGGIVGACFNYSTYNYTTSRVSNCINNGTIKVAENGGGILGTNRGSLQVISCTNNATFSGNNKETKIGGIIGSTYRGSTDVIHCINYGNIEFGKYIGGILGDGGSAEYCENHGAISSLNAKSIGGIVGYAGGAKYCKNFGNIEGQGSYEFYIGGIVGKEGGAVGSVNYGNVTDLRKISGKDETWTYIGGIAGTAYSVDSCCNKGTVSGGFADRAYYIGGISGMGKVNNSENSGAVIGGYSEKERIVSVGGIVGEGNVENSKNYSTVVGTMSIGGITGKGNAKNCINTGSIIGENFGVYTYVGGISSRGACEYCDNSGEVINNNSTGLTGGIVARGDARSCNNSGDVTGVLEKGGTGGIAGLGVDNRSDQFFQFVNCKNTGNIKGGLVGGIAGEATNGKDLINTGTITALDKDYANAGGIFGHGYKIRNCRNEGEIKANKSFKGNYFGGLIGDVLRRSDICIMCCSNIGIVVGEAPNEKNLIGSCYEEYTQYLTDCSQHAHE